MRRPLKGRWSTERRLAAALALLRGVAGGNDLSRGRRAELLTQLASELESRDPWTHGHSRRVAHHAALIAARMGLSDRQVRLVRAAAELHDVGKINTPRAVLHKPGELTGIELELIELHPVDGAEIVSTLGDPDLTAMVRHHHERLDGSGYPDRLTEGEIPLGARIIAVADTFDAITSTRPYRPARSDEQALAILEEEAGVRLDPLGVSAFQACYDERRLRPLWNARRKVVAQFEAKLAIGPR
jgi:putative nucleotidyltransferase with HDIG domain